MHAKQDGSAPNFCVNDHDDHVHMLFKCGCPKKCPTRNYRVECTVQMLVDVVPRENLHIHDNSPKENPTSPDILSSLPTRRYIAEGKGTKGPCCECAVCQEHFMAGDEMIELPCSHVFHTLCLTPWLQKQNTCPTCRYELGKTVKIGEESENPAVLPADEDPGILADFFALGLGSAAPAVREEGKEKKEKKEKPVKEAKPAAPAQEKKDKKKKEKAPKEEKKAGIRAK